MQLSNIPGKLVLPFANAGGKNSIPVASQIGITAGAASLTDGFPPLTRTPIAAGGVPPSGLDMNGILYELSAILRWANAGGGYPFDGTFATDTNVGGYPKGARIMRSDGTGYWFNTAENNVTDPESAGAAAAGWVPDFTTGAATVAMASSSVTLTPAQYGKPLIVITGTLTANLNLIFPSIVGNWAIINSTTGNFTITAKTDAGIGFILSNNVDHIFSNGSDIYATTSFRQNGTGAIVRPINNKAQEIISVQDFGAETDGSVSDLAAFILARDNGKAFFVPSGNYDIPTAFDSQSTPIVSLGAQIDLGVPGSTYLRSFLDIGKKAIFRQSIRDTGEYTGTPTAYTYITDLTSIDIRHQNGAGYQQFFTNDSGGRTAVPAVYIDGSHFGYGDVPGVSVHYGVSRHPSWASIANNWTGANSVVCFDGDVQALTPNVNVYGAEYHLGDQGNDRVAANGLVLDFARNNGNPSVGGAYNTVWTGVRLQTSGTYAADSGLSINGKWNVGIDFSGATLTNNAAITLKTNDRIYFGVPATAPPIWHANVLSNTYMSLETGSLNFINAGVNAFKIESTLVTSTPEHKFINSCNFVSAGYIASTVGAAGGASALPAAPFTYLKIKIDGATYKIPVYNN